MSKILAIDWGSKRVGLALADEVARLPQVLPSLANGDRLFNQLAVLCQAHNVTTIVVGLPRGLEGQETAQTAQVRQFAQQLGKVSQREIKLQDEALTSKAVTAEPNRKPSDVDSAAAALILQDYLEGS